MKEKQIHTLDVSPNNRETQKSILSQYQHQGLLCSRVIVLLQVAPEKFVLDRLWGTLCSHAIVPSVLWHSGCVSECWCQQPICEYNLPVRERQQAWGVGCGNGGVFKSKFLENRAGRDQCDIMDKNFGMLEKNLCAHQRFG